MDIPTILRLEQLAYTQKPYPDPRFPPSIYYRFLGNLVQEMKPKVSVELGVCGGGASLYMARAWPEGTVIGIDVANSYPNQIDDVQARFPNFVFCIGDSVDRASMTHSFWGDVGVLFIDTVHTLERTLLEFGIWRPFMQPGGVVCLDDLFRPGMDEAWDAMPEPKARLDKLHIGGESCDGGFGVVLL